MKIVLAGDVMLGRLVNETLKTKPPEYVWGDTIRIFKNAHLRICNLECVVSDVGEPWSTPPKVFHFRTDEKNIGTLLAAEIGMVSLANNHVLDYNYEGLFRTMKILGENAINFTGVGMDISEASEYAVCKVNSQKVGLIVCTDNEPDWQVTDKNPGTFYIPTDLKDKRVQLLFDQIKRMRDYVDILIVSTHRGPNWGYEPLKEHILFAHALVEKGVDIVFGHFPHIFRAIELYKEKPIMYSTGDFIDDYAVNEIEKNDESFIFVIETDKKKNRAYDFISDSNC